MTNNQELKFIDSYIETMLWSDLPEDSPDADPAAETIERALIECKAFLYRVSCYIEASENTFTQAGHDFWLTRNGHGAGYWEKSDWPVYGEHLDGIAQSFGELNVYVGDEGLVYTE